MSKDEIIPTLTILINFLNAVLGLEKGKRITEVTLLNPYNESEK